MPPCKPLCDITLHLGSSRTAAQAPQDRGEGELPLALGVNVGSLMEGMEELVSLIGMGAKQALLALIQLDLGGFDGSGHAPLLCNQGSNFSVCVMVLLELSCDSPVFLGSGIIVHGSVHRVVGQAFKEPVGKLPFLIDGDALGREEFMPIDGLIDADSAQAVQSV